MELKKPIREYYYAAAGLGLSAIFMKTKFLVDGNGVIEKDQQPIVTSGGNVECVSKFTYLSFDVTSDGKLDTEIKFSPRRLCIRHMYSVYCCMEENGGQCISNTSFIWITFTIDVLGLY